VKKYCSWNENKDVVFIRELRQIAASHNQKANTSTYTKPYKKTPATLFLGLRAACKQMGPSRLKMRGRHSNHSQYICSLFSEKICIRGNSAFSPSICLASCLHAWCTSTTISEANSLRRREAWWLTEVFHKAIHHLLTTTRLTVEREEGVWQVWPPDQNKMCN